MKKYTPEEKAQLLANLDLEVSHRTQQFEEWLSDALENFRIHQEALISRVPRLVRDITLREFAKYDGDIQACLKGIQREKLGGEAEAIDKTTRKRKWIESQETDAKAGVAESLKAAKSARTIAATPKKKAAPSAMSGTAAAPARLPVMNTLGTVRAIQRIPLRAPSPSPHKPAAKPAPFSRPPSRQASPTKVSSMASPSKPSRPFNNRVPSATHFNPHIPAASSSSYPRWPRKDESVLSVNGSPLANPLKLGMDFSGWLSKIRDPGPQDGNSKNGLNRTNNIIVRTASASSSVNAGAPPHQRTTSQASVAGPSHSATHSRTNSGSNSGGRAANGFVPSRHGTQSVEPRTPSPSSSPKLASLPLSLAALVAVPTADGHLLEFDPFQTTPGEIDALDISDGAKQQAKDDMRKLVSQAMERWKIT